jgi:hypothetical protein
MSSFDRDSLKPPAELEDRVVARLRAAGLFDRTDTAREISMKAIHLRWGLAAAALLAAGIWAGTLVPSTGETTAPAAAADTRPKFALMLYEGPGYDAPSEEEHPARVDEYVAWARDLAARGHFVHGNELMNRGVLLHRDRPRSDTVPAGPEGVLDGYFVIRAGSLEEAERIAAECPHLAYGGTVSVRPTGG